jgi:hypothetical protein
MTTIVDVVVPIKTTSKTNARGHWSKLARRASEERGATGYALMRAGLKQRPQPLKVGGTVLLVDVLVDPPLPCTVTLTRLSERELDDDNVRGALKSVRDAVAAWLGIDDRDKRVEWRYGQQKRPRGNNGVHIVVERAA